MSVEVSKVRSFEPTPVFFRNGMVNRVYRIYNQAGVLFNPKTVTMQIRDSTDKLIASVAPVSQTVGEHKLAFVIPPNFPLGTYRIVSSAVEGIYSQTETYTFIVQ